jgi:hypothetical protein
MRACLEAFDVQLDSFAIAMNAVGDERRAGDESRLVQKPFERPADTA